MTDRMIRDATWAGCGCACDDIDLTVRDGRIVEAQRACPLGEAWFAADTPPDAPACLVAGRPASLDQAVERAAEILAAARYPLVYGLAQTSCQAAQLAVGIADWIGGVVDAPGGSKGAIGGGSFPSGGEVTCSFGEIANRADLVVVWRANPVVTHPRHFSRYSLEPRGRFVPGGRADRTLVVVDCGKPKRPPWPIAASRCGPLPISRRCGSCEPWCVATRCSRPTCWPPPASRSTRGRTWPIA